MCHWTAEQWAAIAAFGSAIAAIVQVVVSFWQVKIQRKQERIALSEKRKDIVHRLSLCIGEMINSPWQYDTTSYEFNNLCFSINLIFGENVFKEMSSSTKEILSIGKNWANSFNKEIGFTNIYGDSFKEGRKKCRKEIDKEWLELNEIFKPHLTISKKYF